MTVSKRFIKRTVIRKESVVHWRVVLLTHDASQRRTQGSPGQQHFGKYGSISDAAADTLWHLTVMLWSYLLDGALDGTERLFLGTFLQPLAFVEGSDKGREGARDGVGLGLHVASLSRTLARSVGGASGSTRSWKGSSRCGVIDDWESHAWRRGEEGRSKVKEHENTHKQLSFYPCPTNYQTKMSPSQSEGPKREGEEIERLILVIFSLWNELFFLKSQLNRRSRFK